MNKVWGILYFSSKVCYPTYAEDPVMDLLLSKERLERYVSRLGVPDCANLWLFGFVVAAVAVSVCFFLGYLLYLCRVIFFSCSVFSYSFKLWLDIQNHEFEIGSHIQ